MCRHENFPLPTRSIPQIKSNHQLVKVAGKSLSMCVLVCLPNIGPFAEFYQTIVEVDDSGLRLGLDC